MTPDTTKTIAVSQSEPLREGWFGKTRAGKWTKYPIEKTRDRVWQFVATFDSEYIDIESTYRADGRWQPDKVEDHDITHISPPQAEPCNAETECSDPRYPATVNDYLHLLSSYWADQFPADKVPADEVFSAWEKSSRPLIERLIAAPPPQMNVEFVDAGEWKPQPIDDEYETPQQRIEQDGKTYEWTGETRCPQAGEFYASPANGRIYRTDKGHSEADKNYQPLAIYRESPPANDGERRLYDFALAIRRVGIYEDGGTDKVVKMLNDWERNLLSRINTALEGKP